MNRKEFKFQYYYRRWLCGLPCLIIGVFLSVLLQDKIQSTVLYYVMCAMIIVVLLSLYYTVTNRLQIFVGSGSYWLDDGIIYIQLADKVHQISDVTEVLGSTISVYNSQCASLFVQWGGENGGKVKLFSAPLTPDREFKDSSVYPIYQMILAQSPDLERVKVTGQDTEYWYQKK